MSDTVILSLLWQLLLACVSWLCHCYQETDTTAPSRRHSLIWRERRAPRSLTPRSHPVPDAEAAWHRTSDFRSRQGVCPRAPRSLASPWWARRPRSWQLGLAVRDVFGTESCSLFGPQPLVVFYKC